MMQNEGAFPKLVELVRVKQEDDSGMHRLLLELLYEMSRMQRLTREDLGGWSALGCSQSVADYCSCGRRCVRSLSV